MKSKDFTTASDMALVELTREGNSQAYAELWKRHASAVIAATRGFTGYDPDDIAQETFLRVLQQIQAGGGPQTAFRAYAIMTARNVAVNMSRDRSSDEITGVDDEVFDLTAPAQPDTAGESLNSAFVIDVFSSLPTRWQEALWYREVEGVPVQEFSQYLGMSDNATSALLKRAREGFKQTWIAANLEPVQGLPQGCQHVVDKLPQLTRGKASARVRNTLESHIATCPTCSPLAKQAAHISSDLARVLVPGVLGVPAAAEYLAWLRSGAETQESGASFDADSAMAMNPVPPAHPPVGLAGTTITKALSTPVAVFSVGALAAAVAVALTLGGLQPGPTESEPQKPTVSSAQERDTAEKEKSDEAARRARDREKEKAAADAARAEAEAEQEAPAAGAVPQEDVNAGEGPPAMPPPVAPSPLRGTPIDGIETGIFPQIIGMGAAEATIQLTIRNEQGQAETATVASDRQGRWAYTANSVMGQVTVSGTQAYSYLGRDYVDAEAVIGTYQVGRGLGISVEQTGAQQTTIRLTGIGSGSKNQVVNVESTGLGTLASRKPATGPGEVVIVVPHARPALGDIRFWQGDTSEGPRRVWWRNLTTTY